MIVVIADDFTGAAELAGISLRYGLTVELSFGITSRPTADVCIVCSNSRSFGRDDAIRITEKLMQEILPLKPAKIYKKTDSVFRGHVLDELDIQMRYFGCSKAFLLGANPSLGRTILNGEYFIDGEKITETGFVNDPEFPVKTSLVKDMLGNGRLQVQVLKNSDPLPAAGIVAGEAVVPSDVSKWLSVLDDSWMLAGAGDLFEAFLFKTFKARPQQTATLESPHLYVCGTAFLKRKKFIDAVSANQHCVMYLTPLMFENDNARDDHWINAMGEIIAGGGKVIIAIDESRFPEIISPLRLRTVMAKMVKTVVEKYSIREIFIEGGSTAAAVLEVFGIEKLVPVNELQRGVVRMKAAGVFITVKPGSYDLPPQILALYANH